jgi:CRISPR-associated protein Csc1
MDGGTSCEIYYATLTLMEHTYFASREVGILYETEPLIGNYALAYALGLCQAPYNWCGPPRYKLDLGLLNEQGIYVTPATFQKGMVRYAFSQFNAQTDSYFSRFDQNAIGTHPEKKARPANFPQSGKIRLLGRESRAFFFLLNSTRGGTSLRLPDYIRLGKFNSKARVQWERLPLVVPHPVEREQAFDFLLNAVDLPRELRTHMTAFSITNIYPAPLLKYCQLKGAFWHCQRETGQQIFLPTGMRFGVDALE